MLFIIVVLWIGILVCSVEDSDGLVQYYSIFSVLEMQLP